MVFSLFAKKTASVTVVAPLTGEMLPLERVPDPVFSQKMMGHGFAIVPSEGKVVAPVSGVVATLFPTKHAIGIRTPEELEILVHVGVDTVNLNGEGLTALVKEGDRVTAGQPVLEIDLKSVGPKVPSLATPVVFTRMEGWTFSQSLEGTVRAGEEIGRLTR